jgi:acyl carrier protein
MQRDAIEAKVVYVLSVILKLPVEATTHRAETPQWDSLRHIEIIFAIEEELGIEFSESELAELDSVSRIVDTALGRHAA